MKNPTTVMPDIIIPKAGISNVLKNLNQRKAAGPDKIKDVVLQELREELVPILKILFPNDWTSANVSPLLKMVTSSAASYRPKRQTVRL